MVPGLLFICSLCGLNGISYLLCTVGMGEEPKKKKKLRVLFIVQSKVLKKQQYHKKTKKIDTHNFWNSVLPFDRLFSLPSYFFCLGIHSDYSLVSSQDDSISGLKVAATALTSGSVPVGVRCCPFLMTNLKAFHFKAYILFFFYPLCLIVGLHCLSDFHTCIYWQNYAFKTFLGDTI